MKVEPRPQPPAARSASTPAVEAQQPLAPRAEQRFEALLSRRELRARRSLRGDLAGAEVAPADSAALFAPARSVQLLQYLLDEVLPGLDAEPPIKALASELLGEEIETRQWLEQQRGAEVTQ